MNRSLPALDQIERLLIVKTSSIGDVIHALPVVQAIKEARPGLSLGWVVRQRCADVLRGCPWIDDLYVVPDKPSLRDLMTLRKTLQPGRYQCVLDMQGLFLSGLLTWLSGAPVRIGWDRNREGNAVWMTHPVVPGRVSDMRGDRHEVEALYGFAQAFGVDVPHAEFTPQPYLAAEASAQAEDWMRSLPRPRIALSLGASRSYKRWPTENWLTLADALVGQNNGIVFIGDQRDAETVAPVKSMMKRLDKVVDLSGRTDLRQLASVLAACDLVISGDSGPVHLAVAVGTPVVALFGATNPARHGPYGTRNVVVQKVPPSAHGSHRPTDEDGQAAMRAIMPADVLAAVESRLVKI
jgi:lipopolysaccharide heptosyltransferase I